MRKHVHLHTHAYVPICIYTLCICNRFNIKYILHIVILTIESLNDRRIKKSLRFLLSSRFSLPFTDIVYFQINHLTALVISRDFISQASEEML